MKISRKLAKRGAYQHFFKELLKITLVLALLILFSFFSY